MEKHEEVGVFYGLPITAEMAEAAGENLTAPGRGLAFDDLVEAHLAVTYSDFVAIDKTLSGFFVLCNEGEEYTVLDVRGGGRVWWQDQDTREIHPRFDNLQDWVAFNEAVEDGDDEDELLETYWAEHPEPAQIAGPGPSTADLAYRYQWLVWFLVKSKKGRNDEDTKYTEELMSDAVDFYYGQWPSAQDVEESLGAELPLLVQDPHLAVYWLLHTSVLAMDEQRARVLDALGPAAVRLPLVQAFADYCGSLSLDGDVSALPDFRRRRAVLLTRLTILAPEEDRPAIAMRCMQISSATRPLQNVATIVGGLTAGWITDAEVTAAVARMDASAGVSALRGLLDIRAGLTGGTHADDFLRSAVTGDEDWGWLFTAVWEVRTGIHDADALAAVVAFLFTRDPYKRQVLLLARQAQELAGRVVFAPDGEWEHRIALAQASVPVMQELLQTVRDGEDSTVAAERVSDPELADVVARRVLHRLGYDGYGPTVCTWAIQTVLAGTGAGRIEAAAIGLEALPIEAQRDVLGRLSRTIDGIDHPLVDVLLKVLVSEPSSGDSDMRVRRLKAAALGALSPIAAEPELFDQLLRLAELPGDATFLWALWDTLFDPSEPETCILPRLSDAQATRVARAMVAVQVAHPSKSCRAHVGHTLYRFNHAGAQEYLIEALDIHCRLFAEASPRYDSADTQVEKVVANLYSAVSNIRTPRCRSALIERLFSERREFWRMGDAIGEIFDADVHRETLEALRERRDGVAAGHYAYALATFVKQDPPKVDLLAELVQWDVPADELPRRRFKYALVVGIGAALSADSNDLVRSGHALAQRIAERPQEPCEDPRATFWEDPSTREGKAARRLAKVLSGAAEA